MRLTRRSLIAAALLAPTLQAWAKPANAFDVLTDDGAPLANHRLAPELSPANLPGVILAGPASAGLALYDIFDYACPYCRAAAQELDLLLTPDAGFRLGLVHHPMLTQRSAEVARLVLAAAQLYGDAAAYRLHAELMETPGRIGPQSALAAGARQGLDPGVLQRMADGVEVAAILRAQSEWAQALALPLPGFVLGDVAIAGWPGVRATDTFMTEMRRCGGLSCPAL